MWLSDETQSLLRPRGKRVMRLLRRAHLYLGLFLFPWAILYGVTAFLFNHPTAFSDVPATMFGAWAFAGTPYEQRPTANELAAQVVSKLNENQKPATLYTVAGDAKFSREYAFGMVKAEGKLVSFLVDVKSGSGTLRSAVVKDKTEPERPSFANGRTDAGVVRKASTPPRSDGIFLDNPIHERVKASIPTVLERTGFSMGEVTVTSVPDVVFPVLADGRIWTASYNPMTGIISGTPADSKPETELTWRRFLLRLHTAHGYPDDTNAKWFWAVIVDVMAFVLCFWGFTGLLMWWQIQSTRTPGIIVLILSAISATAIGIAMHESLR